MEEDRFNNNFNFKTYWCQDCKCRGQHLAYFNHAFNAYVCKKCVSPNIILINKRVHIEPNTQYLKDPDLGNHFDGMMSFLTSYETWNKDLFKEKPLRAQI